MDYLLNLINNNWRNLVSSFVLNLIINGLPSKLKEIDLKLSSYLVLNLIINGLPSKLVWKTFKQLDNEIVF